MLQMVGEGSRPAVLGPSQARLVDLPQHRCATVRFDLNVDGATCRTITFGSADGIPMSVCGSATDHLSTAMADRRFPHKVFNLGGKTNPVAMALGSFRDVLFTLEIDSMFADSWRARARCNTRCDNCCYNTLHRYGLKRARNMVLAVLLSHLISRFFGEYTLGLLAGVFIVWFAFVVFFMDILKGRASRDNIRVGKTCRRLSSRLSRHTGWVKSDASCIGSKLMSALL